MMRKIITTAYTLSVVMSAVADYTIYGGDVAAESVTSKETRILFAGNTGEGRTYTLSKDASIHSGGMANTGSVGNPQKAIFDFTSGNYTLTLRSGTFLTYRNDVELWFKGGTWDFGEHSFYAVGKPAGASYGYRNLIVLTNGCKFTNCVLGDAYKPVLYASSDIRMIITGGSSVTSGAMGMFANEDPDGMPSTNMYFEVSDGASLACGDFTFDKNVNSVSAAVDRGNRMLVTGAGSRFIQSGSFMMGSGTKGNMLEIADGAEATIGYPRLGYDAGTSQTGIYVHDGASFIAVNGMMFGSSNGGSSYVADCGGMFLRVVNATAKIGSSGGQNLILGSANNELLLSNAVFKCAAIRVGEVAGATNDIVRILGPDTSFTSSSWKPLFGNGGGGVLEIGDRANVSVGELAFDSWNGNSASTATYASSSNTLRVTDGASLSLGSSGTFSIGNSKEAAASDNVVEVSGGATLYTATSVFVEGHGSTLVVDDATFTNSCNTISSQGNDGVAVFVGRNADGRTSTNCAVVVRGSHPMIRIPYTTMCFNVNSRLRFELPPNGYDYETEGEAPLEVHQLMNQSMDYEITGLDELQKNITGRTKDIPLVKMTYRMWNGSAAFAALDRVNAKLEVSNPGCRLHKETNPAGGEIIYLCVKRKTPGTLIVVQ